MTTIKKVSHQDIINSNKYGHIFDSFSNQWYEMLQEIMNLNKKYYMNLLVSSDLQKKYEKSLDDNKRLEDEIKILKKEKDTIEQILRDSIPVEL